MRRIKVGRGWDVAIHSGLVRGKFTMKIWRSFNGKTWRWINDGSTMDQRWICCCLIHISFMYPIAIKKLPQCAITRKFGLIHLPIDGILLYDTISKMIPLALILKSERGTHFPIAFWISFFLVGCSNLLIFTDFQLPLLFPSSRLLSLSLLLASPPQTSKNHITKKGWAVPCLKPLVLSKAGCLGSFGGEEKRGNY